MNSNTATITIGGGHAIDRPSHRPVSALFFGGKIEISQLGCGKTMQKDSRCLAFVPMQMSYKISSLLCNFIIIFIRKTMRNVQVRSLSPVPNKSRFWAKSVL